MVASKLSLSETPPPMPQAEPGDIPEPRKLKSSFKPPSQSDGAEFAPEKPKGRAGSAARSVAPKATDAVGKAPGSADLGRVLDRICKTIAKIPGQEHWQLEADEIKEVSEPIARLAAGSSTQAKWIAENSNIIVLTVALVTVFGSRLLQSVWSTKNESSSGTDSTSREDGANPFARRVANRSLELVTLGSDGDRGAEHRANGTDGQDVDALNSAIKRSLNDQIDPALR